VRGDSDLPRRWQRGDNSMVRTARARQVACATGHIAGKDRGAADGYADAATRAVFGATAGDRQDRKAVGISRYWLVTTLSGCRHGGASGKRHTAERNDSA
jgi:hypothetical protein